MFSFFFFFNDTATTEIYTLSLHDALPISWVAWAARATSLPPSFFSRATMLATSPATSSTSTEACIWRDRRSEEHTSELQSRLHLVCRLLLEKKKNDLLVIRYNVMTLQVVS